VHDIGSCDAAVHLAEKLIHLIEQPIAGLPATPAISASIGICMFPQDGLANTAEAIIRRADQAMYRAKAAGKRRYHLSQ